MILYLKQSTEPGDVLFHVLDESGRLCYEIYRKKHWFGKRIYVETVQGEQAAYINCIGFANMLRGSVFISGKKQVVLLCSFAAAEPLFKIHGQTWGFRGDVLLGNFDVVDVDRTVIFIHGAQWTPGTGSSYILQIEQPAFAVESLCISALIDGFALGGECMQAAAEMN